MFNLFLPKKNKIKTDKGFMLVEMIVSVAIFSIVMIASMGSLLGIIDANKKSQTFKIVINNLNLAMESMTRDIQTGSDYNCDAPTGGSCSDGGDSIYLISDKGKSVVYRRNGNAIEKSTDGGANFFGITAPDIQVEKLKFYVFGADNFTHPRVTIVVEGSAGDRAKTDTQFNLQTTVSQRSI